MTKCRLPPKTRRSPRGAFGSAGAQAPCWVGPGAAWPPIGCRSTAALLTYWRARCLPSVSTRVCPCGGPVHQRGHPIHGAWLGCVDRANFRIRPRRTQPQCGRVWTLGWVTRAGLDRAWAYPRGPWSNAGVRRDSVHAGVCCVGRRARPPHTIYPPCTASATFERSQLAAPPGLARGVPNARRWPPAFCSRRLLSGAG